MTMEFRITAEGAGPQASGRAVLPTRLSGRVLGQLGTAEQLVIWAFRETPAADPGATERLARGFRLAFGAKLIGAAACGFDGLKRCLLAEPERGPRLCPLHCACLGIDEERLLGGLAAAQLGDRSWHDTELGPFVAPVARLQLWRQSRLFSSALGQVGLVLPDARLLALDQATTPH